MFFRNGIYYFLWSVDDTGSPNYHVAYGTSTSPTGPIRVARQPIVVLQDPDQLIYGTGHCSVVCVPGTDDWYLVYHRINPSYLSNGPGYHREVCVDRLTFNDDGTIQRVTPTNRGIDPVQIADVEGLISGIEDLQQNPATDGRQPLSHGVRYYSASGNSLGAQAPTRPGLYLRQESLPNGRSRVVKMVVK